MATPRGLAIGIGLALSWGTGAHAYLARDSVTWSSEVVVNPAAGAPRSGCQATEPLTAHRARTWSFDVSRNGEIRCRHAPSEAVPPSSEPVSRDPYLTGEVALIAKSHPQMEDERILELEVSIDLEEVSSSDNGERTGRRASQPKRSLFFAEDAEALVPLWVADESEREASGVREVFLRLHASTVAANAAASHGVLTVRSGLPGAELLLDGGAVGSLSAKGEMTLPHVRAGLHLVRQRDASGREVVKAVRVEPDRTVLIDLGRPAMEPRSYRLTPLGKNSQGYEEYRREADRAVVVKIPAGEFVMGNPETERSPLEHRVYVSDFLMDKTGVTWGQYKNFVAATAIPLPRHEPFWGIRDDHPAVYVSWEESKAYCEWVGGRLPTEAEREKAARGTDLRKYPWGDELPDPSRAVFRRSWGYEATDPVGAHPAGASPYGVLDLGGNVWEWCSDWYDETYYAVSPYRDPPGPPSGRAHAARGGSWDSRPSVLSSSARNFGHRGYREGDFGFRCVMNARD